MSLNLVLNIVRVIGSKLICEDLLAHRIRLTLLKKTFLMFCMSPSMLNFHLSGRSLTHLDKYQLYRLHRPQYQMDFTKIQTRSANL